MKTHILVAALAGALSAAALAQSAPPIDAVVVRPQGIELPSQMDRLWYNEFEQVSGLYRLSNGKRMELSMDAGHMYAKIDGMKKTRIVAASPYVFVAADRQFRITAADPNQLRGAADVDVQVARMQDGQVMLTSLTAAR
jgi:hypothetical protein